MGYRNDDRREYRNDESDDEEVLGPFLYLGLGIAGLLIVAGVLDNWFGWGLTPWLWGLIRQMLGGDAG